MGLPDRHRWLEPDPDSPDDVVGECVICRGPIYRWEAEEGRVSVDIVTWDRFHHECREEAEE